MVIEHPYTYNLKRTTNIFSDKEVLYEIKNVKDITTSDHIVGPDIEKASFVLIEYSDYTCLFCAAMRNTLKEIVDEYNATLVYRHFFPLANLNGIRRAVLQNVFLKLKTRFGSTRDVLLPGRLVG